MENREGYFGKPTLHLRANYQRCQQLRIEDKLYRDVSKVGLSTADFKYIQAEIWRRTQKKDALLW